MNYKYSLGYLKLVTSTKPQDVRLKSICLLCEGICQTNGLLTQWTANVTLVQSARPSLPSLRLTLCLHHISIKVPQIKVTSPGCKTQ
jgi:hypothetical protein